MEFRIRAEYSKDFLKNVYKEEFKGFILFLEILSIIAVILCIITIALFDSNNKDIINLIISSLLLGVWLNTPLISASIQMFNIKKSKLDGVRVFNFNNQTILVNYLKYNRNVSFSLQEIKKIKKKKNYYKIWINRKYFYINVYGFEIGNAEDFYNWIVSLKDSA